ncbi:helix-turn-helix transcriptional regulator [Sulfurirhabdus autotrophica]|uniref:Helix-turn-helix protein n=1 Tax=Sulfurirhabdus autotrophica TaxID=1706046 RepID=A0A4R3XSW6_9PROT|nr:helix-turn-helix transcriptional regulator [Sulfurirhabdus autotrophica]TCV81073.1 helix-turn-helix protein [Sulfurirhabdus autotrophica]
MNYALKFANQLTPQLRSFRKAHGLTQAQLAKMLGVNQSRIAVIEKNPGVLSVDQLFRVLSALEVEILLQDKRARILTEGTDPNSMNSGTINPLDNESW